jgi:leucyl-tRNA synthetase
LFSRQRYWGEPFPIVYDADGVPHAVPDSMLPVELPDITDFEPRILADDTDLADHGGLPEPPLARAEDWVHVELDLGEGRQPYTRETNTMPQWAGSCWYYLRYLDPTNANELVDPEIDRYWMGEGGSGGVDLYVGGAEHAVLHLLYARFWHKVLFDLGQVSTPEPFHRLFNQGTITAAAFTDERGAYVEASEVVERDGSWFHDGAEVIRHDGKMGKSLKNAVAPDDIYRDYGADTLRLYEMFTGPLDASRPWSTQDIVGVHKFLQRFWRNAVDEDSGELHVTEVPADDDTRRQLHRTIAAVVDDMAKLEFNTAIAALMELNNRLTRVVQQEGSAPREVVRAMVLMLSPLTPHVAEELWSRLGERAPLAYADFPEPDPALLVDDTVEVPVQVNGKVRAKVTLPAGASEADHEAAGRADPRIAELLAGTTVRKVVVVPDRMVNFVVA